MAGGTPADGVGIRDSGGYFPGVNDVEDALQALGKFNNGGSLPIAPAATISALEAAYPNGVVVAHSLGADLFPENTLQAAKACIAVGIPMVDAKIRSTADGAQVLIHDATIDRTTTGTGNVSDQSALSIAQLVNDPATYLGPGLANITSDGVPFLRDYLDKFGGKVGLMFEFMDGAHDTMIRDAITSRGLTSSVIVSSRTLSYLTKFTAAGIKTMFVDDTGTTYTPSALVAAGLYGVLVKTPATAGSGATQSTINALTAAGLKVGMYTVERQKDFSSFTGLSYIIANQPVYLQSVMYGNNFHRRTSDAFASGSFYPGHIPSYSNPGVTTYKDSNGFAKGNILSGGRNQWDGGNGGVSMWRLLGELCPVASPAGTYTISYTFSCDTADSSAASSWIAFFVCQPDDTDFYDSAAATGRSGYLLLFRQSGAMEYYKFDGTVPSKSGLLSSQSTAAVLASGTATFTIAISPTQVVWTRTDVGSPNSITIADTSFRGAYHFWGAKYASSGGSQGRFSVESLSVA